ncbi:hypothetical protein DL93DRAFT_2199012 [Clavulina sp. PMI_390]|nr:hypothetical protein DL93DRAFT_2199012 [Clavulina sp. PMI_390]
MVLASAFEHAESATLQMILGIIATVHGHSSTASIKSLASWTLPLATLTTQGGAEKIISLLSFLVAGERDIDSTAKIPTSFMNYLKYVNIAKAYVQSDPSSHQVLAIVCLSIMQNKENGLHFNMCKLGTSSKLNSQINNLPALIDEHIGDTLSYASRFWAFHVAQAHTLGAALLDSIKNLLSSRHFLHWLEVMSVIKSDPHQNLLQLKTQSHTVCEMIYCD